MAIKKRVRFEVLRRDDYTCRYCGGKAPDVRLTVDHVIPDVLGGPDDPSNLVTACVDCNSGKSSIQPDQPLVEGVAEDALRWADAMKAAAAQQAARAAEVQQYQDAFLALWNRWSYGPESDKRNLPLPPEWKNSVRNFQQALLPLAVLGECVEIAMGAPKVATENVFRYMCGVAWNKVTEQQGLAKQLLVEHPAGPADAYTPDSSNNLVPVWKDLREVWVTLHTRPESMSEHAFESALAALKAFNESETLHECYGEFSGSRICTDIALGHIRTALVDAGAAFSIRVGSADPEAGWQPVAAGWLLSYHPRLGEWRSTWVGYGYENAFVPCADIDAALDRAGDDLSRLKYELRVLTGWYWRDTLNPYDTHPTSVGLEMHDVPLEGPALGVAPVLPLSAQAMAEETAQRLFGLSYSEVERLRREWNATPVTQRGEPPLDLSQVDAVSGWRRVAGPPVPEPLDVTVTAS